MSLLGLVGLLFFVGAAAALPRCSADAADSADSADWSSSCKADADEADEADEEISLADVSFLQVDHHLTTASTAAEASASSVTGAVAGNHTAAEDPRETLEVSEVAPVEASGPSSLLASLQAWKWRSGAIASEIQHSGPLSMLATRSATVSSRSGQGESYLSVGLAVGLLVLLFAVAYLVFPKSSTGSSKASEAESASTGLVAGAAPVLSPGRTPIRSPGRQPGTAEALLAARRAAEEATARPAGASVGPPVLCPALVLASTEARFMIAMDSLLDKSTSSWDITGTSGRKLLHAFTSDYSPGGGRCLKLCSVGCDEDPRATVCIDPAVGNSLRIFFRGGGPQGMLYGTLGASPEGKGVELVCDGVAVMIVQVQSISDLQMTAFTMDGRQLAVSARAGDPGSRRAMAANGGGDAWRLQVKPGVDAVLMAGCMLSMALLQPDLLHTRSSPVDVPAAAEPSEPEATAAAA